MKKLLLSLVIVSISFMMMAADCTKETSSAADINERARQEQLQEEAQAQAGLPAIHNFQEKKLLKMIYELRDDEKLICYAYLYNELNGKLTFFGKCLGYGIPYSTQYSNPQKTIEGATTGEFTTIPQAEPNGLFMPSSSEGTWLMLLDKDGKPHPVYIEPRILVSPFPLSF